MQLKIVSFREMKLQEIEGITYNGIVNGRASFTIRGNTYTYAPDASHSDVNAWDQEIRNTLGAYNQSGKALNFVKKTSSDYVKESVEDDLEDDEEFNDVMEATTTADMSLQMIDTTDYDEKHRDDKDKPMENN